MANPLAATAPSGEMNATFEIEQQEYFEGETGYVDPRHPTARAFAFPKLEYILSQLSSIQTVLDVGAGNGTFTYYWQAHVETVEGIELSYNLISQSPCVDRLRHGNVYNLPYAENAFDLIFESNLLHHLAHPVRALAEMKRVARKYVVCLEPNRNNPLMFAFASLCAVERKTLKFSPRYLRQLMNQVGLTRTALRTTGMISQHRTPPWILPLLKPFDRSFPLGMYTIAIAKK